MPQEPALQKDSSLVTRSVPQLQEEVALFEQQLQALKDDFLVPDVLTEESSLIFLLESPHVQELKYQAPVSGLSGASMTKHLFGPEYSSFPLGRMMQQSAKESTEEFEAHRSRLNAIGLMNVCNVPMQGAAYGDSSVRQDHAAIIGALEYIRTNNQRDSYANVIYNAAQEAVLSDLRRRLSTLPDVPLTFVPCGRFSQKFFRLAAVTNPKWAVIENVPHPAYNSWDRPRYAVSIEQLKTVFSQL